MRYRRRIVGREEHRPEDFAPLSQEEQEVLLRVVEVLRKVKYGTVLLVVQDGKVVQIEMAEKIRLR
ncbi:MAG: YezD family protein [Actinomycetota bacterium]|nr:YezD family protein [Actinomycetota bacterium]